MCGLNYVSMSYVHVSASLSIKLEPLWLRRPLRKQPDDFKTHPPSLIFRGGGLVLLAFVVGLHLYGLTLVLFPAVFIHPHPPLPHLIPPPSPRVVNEHLGQNRILCSPRP